MPNSYLADRDVHAGSTVSFAAQARLAALVDPNDGADLPLYAKAFRVYVPLGTAEATVRVTPMAATDDAATVTFRFQTGISYEPLAVRRIWATGTTAGLEIHAYTV